jgi:hypothetical protein
MKMKELGAKIVCGSTLLDIQKRLNKDDSYWMGSDKPLDKYFSREEENKNEETQLPIIDEETQRKTDLRQNLLDEGSYESFSSPNKTPRNMDILVLNPRNSVGKNVHQTIDKLDQQNHGIKRIKSYGDKLHNRTTDRTNEIQRQLLAQIGENEDNPVSSNKNSPYYDFLKS